MTNEPTLLEQVGISAINDETRVWIEKTAGPTVRLRSEDEADLDLIIYGNDYTEKLARMGELASHSHLKSALCLDKEFRDSFLGLLALNMRHIIYPSSPFAENALRLLLRTSASLDTTASNIQTFLGVGFTDHNSAEFTVQLRTLEDISAIPAIREMLVGHGFPDSIADNVALSIREVAINCTYHGFRGSKSHERKYLPDTFECLTDGDTIELSLLQSTDWSAIKITDNAGTLGPLSLANSLDRQTTEQGLYDSRGRGFYLMRNLAHRAVVIVKRRCFTSIELYFLHNTDGDFPRHFELIEI